MFKKRKPKPGTVPTIGGLMDEYEAYKEYQAEAERRREHEERINKAIAAMKASNSPMQASNSQPHVAVHTSDPQGQSPHQHWTTTTPYAPTYTGSGASGGSWWTTTPVYDEELDTPPSSLDGKVEELEAKLEAAWEAIVELQTIIDEADL